MFLFNNPPALIFAQRAAFHKSYLITGLEFIFRIMNFIARADGVALLILRIDLDALDFDYDGLIALVTNNHAAEFFADNDWRFNFGFTFNWHNFKNLFYHRGTEVSEVHGEHSNTADFSDFFCAIAVKFFNELDFTCYSFRLLP